MDNISNGLLLSSAAQRKLEHYNECLDSTIVQVKTLIDRYIEENPELFINDLTIVRHDRQRGIVDQETGACYESINVFIETVPLTVGEQPRYHVLLKQIKQLMQERNMVYDDINERVTLDEDEQAMLHNSMVLAEIDASPVPISGDDAIKSMKYNYCFDLYFQDPVMYGRVMASILTSKLG